MASVSFHVALVLFLEPLHADVPDHTEVRVKLFMGKAIQLEKLILLLDLGEVVAYAISYLQDRHNLLLFRLNENAKFLALHVLLGQAVQGQPQMSIGFTNLVTEHLHHLHRLVVLLTLA